jgi:hypothetical protein
MSNKKISEFPIITTSALSDIFLIDHFGTTSTIAMSTVTDSISTTVINGLSGDTVIAKLSGSFIKKPTTASAQQVLTYSGTTNTWVASAAPDGVGDYLLTSNGYTKYGNGLILQWGRTSSALSVGGTQAVTFPINFPSACLNLSLTVGSTPSPDNGVSAPLYTSLTRLGFTAVNKDTDSSYVISYFAVGY